LTITIVTNIPAPYRVPVWEKASKLLDKFSIIFCASKESNRMWEVRDFLFDHFFLREHCSKKNEGHYIHNNPDIWKLLNRLNPDIVITTGFNPTHLYAFIWTIIKRRKHICMTDGTLKSESILSWKHKLLRYFVYKYSKSFIAASHGGIALYRSYGIKPTHIFQSHLCADNDRFESEADNIDRPYDVMFSSRFEEVKLPFLFVDICIELKRLRGSCSALLIGDGSLRNEVIFRLSAAGINYHYAGFLQQAELPTYYSKAKILLFTTKWDPWGVIANESMAAGTPVITTPQAGAAGELVIDGVTGAVCAPIVDIWVAAAIRLLEDPKHWISCSNFGRERVAYYNYQAAADGIANACVFSSNKDLKR
jgi:glycosyltransferase involved in cell wall biosynthesis